MISDVDTVSSIVYDKSYPAMLKVTMNCPLLSDNFFVEYSYAGAGDGYTFYYLGNVRTVTFDMQGHGEQIESQLVTTGSTATKPGDPVADGYTFDGWFTDAECTTPYDFETGAITENTTLYAKWTPNQ